jgi:uncharacterized protein YodC (DUF2158 family)
VEFKKGDVVRLKSGGPEMTVENTGERAMIGGQAVWCTWFENSGRKQSLARDTFDPEILEHVSDEVQSVRFVRG